MARTGRPKKESTDYFQRGRLWYATYRDRDGTRRSRSTGEEDRGRAEVEHCQWLIERSRPARADASEVSLAVCLHHYAQHAKTLRSARDAGRSIGYIAEFFGGDAVSELTRHRQIEFHAWLASRGHSTGYARRTVAILAAALRRAKEDEMITGHPVIRRPPAGQPRRRWLSPDEAAALLSAMTEPDCRRFAMLALFTGARAEAIYQLTWDRVDLLRGWVDYHCPGHAETTKRRAVTAISGPLAAELAAVPQDERSGHVVRVASVKRSFRTARDRAGLGKDVTENTLRHTFASWAMQRGESSAKIGEAIGNSAEMVDRHYGHLAPDRVTSVTNAVGDEFSSSFRAENGV